MILPDWMSEERPVVTKVGRNNFLIRNRHHLEALLQKFETHPLYPGPVLCGAQQPGSRLPCAVGDGVSMLPAAHGPAFDPHRRFCAGGAAGRHRIFFRSAAGLPHPGDRL